MNINRIFLIEKVEYLLSKNQNVNIYLQQKTGRKIDCLIILLKSAISLSWVLLKVKIKR